MFDKKYLTSSSVIFVNTLHIILIPQLNSNLKNIYKLKKYNVDNVSIGAGDCVSILISSISGYYPIGSFYCGQDEENVIFSTSPRLKESTNLYEVKLFNYYTSTVRTNGYIIILYINIKDFD